VADCIDSLKKMATENVSGQIINIGPDEEFISIFELAQIIAELLDFKLCPIYFADRPQEVKYAYCSSDKARKLLGYETKYKLKQGLQEMIDDIKKKGVRNFKYHLPLEIVNDKTPRTWVDKQI